MDHVSQKMGAGKNTSFRRDDHYADPSHDSIKRDPITRKLIKKDVLLPSMLAKHWGVKLQQNDDQKKPGASLK